MRKSFFILPILLLTVSLIIIPISTGYATPHTDTNNSTITIPFTQKCLFSDNVNYSGIISINSHYLVDDMVNGITPVTLEGATITTNFPKELSHCYIEYGEPPAFESLTFHLTQDNYSCTQRITSHSSITNNCSGASVLAPYPIHITGTVVYDLGGPFTMKLSYPFNVIMP